MKSIISLLCVFSVFQLLAQPYTDYIGAGQSIDISASSSDPQSQPMAMLNGHGLDIDIKAASRFLARSTMGFTIDDVVSLTESDYESWIDNQLDAPMSLHTDATVDLGLDLFEQCNSLLGPIFCLENFMPSADLWRVVWWDHVMKGQDQLRQRVAMALSEILVISSNSQLINRPDGLANYYDILVRNAFGNYRDILMEVSLHPSMGFYLSHLNNPRTIESLNIRPDENYAREIMQLFTVGLYELHPNGERKVNMSNGAYIPTYTEDDIKGLAKVFTGLGGSKSSNPAQPDNVEFGRPLGRISAVDPMRMYEEWHEPGEKTIIGGHVIPAGQSGMEDISQAIDVLFNHENTGPFICKQLIQRLVKSNPSPAYVERVANVFADNGNSVRGDMESVIKAILTDNEAYNCYWQEDIGNGMLRSPLLRYTQMMKGLQAETETDIFFNNGNAYNFFLNQNILSAPSVFNFYAPDYVPNADFAYEGLVGPEFQILTSSSSSNYVNYMILAFMGEYLNEQFNLAGTPNEIANIFNGPDNELNPFDPDKEKYRAKLTDPLWHELAYSAYDLVDYLDILLCNGSMEEDTKLRIASAMNNESLFTPEQAKNYAAMLVLIDPDFVIMK